MHDAMRHTVRQAATLRVATLALAALLAVGTFLSAIALGREVHHQCTGDNCPVCRLMVGAAKVVGRSSTAAPSALRIPSAHIAATRITPLAGAVLVASSPVSLGVRLDI